MKEYNITLTLQETAIIAAECSMSLNDNRCSDPEGRAALEKIIVKMAEPFGFSVEQLQSITASVRGQSTQLN